MFETLFLVCFLFGLIFSAVSFLLGATASVHLSTAHAGHVAAPAHGPTHFGHAHPHLPVAHGQQDAGPRLFEDLPLFSFSALLAFLVAFGGIGFLLTHYLGWTALPALALAIPAGIAGDVAIALFLASLIRSEHVLSPEDFRLEGVIAEVSVNVSAGGVGEIIYSQNGRRWSAAARSDAGQPIPRGAKVVILRYENGVAFVQTWNDFVKDSAPDLVE
jgi:membrane protein implicated in regulation of membrane protease activity